MFVALIPLEALNSVPWCVDTALHTFLNGRRDLEQGIDEKRAD